MKNINKNNSNTVLISFIWKLAERSGVQFFSLLVTIILARILPTETYGVLSILLIFITISQIFIQNGLGTALIQKKEPTLENFSAVFYISLFIAIILYIFLYLLSPSISKFFNLPLLKIYLRIMALILLLGPFNMVLNAILVKEMNFKTLFYCNLSAGLISGIVGIFAAILGFGVWSLIIQQFMNQICAVFLMEIFVHWVPQKIKTIKNSRELLYFGLKIMMANLIGTGYNQLRSLVIGKKFTIEALAFHDKGKQFPQFFIHNLDSPIQNVLLPVLSSSQNDLSTIKKQVRKSIRISTFIIFPAMIGLAIIARPLILILLTDKWENCIPFLQIYCFTFVWTPIQTTNMQVIVALGKSDLALKLELIKKSFGMIVLFITIIWFNDVLQIAYGGLLLAIFSMLISMFPNRKLIEYSFREQLADILSSILGTSIMSLITIVITFFISNNYLLLFMQICIGFMSYLLFNTITKNTELKYIKQTIAKIMK